MLSPLLCIYGFIGPLPELCRDQTTVFTWVFFTIVGNYALIDWIVHDSLYAITNKALSSDNFILPISSCYRAFLGSNALLVYHFSHLGWAF